MPVISTNLAANSAVRYLNINSTEQTSSLSKLASGSRITQAQDDAAGLAISTKISSDVTALTQAATNASHGVSVLQTADGGASNISDILQRMKSLASQASSGTVTDTERAYIEAEFSELVDEIDGIATGTRYNGQSLLDGTSAFGDGVSVMVGSDATDTITVSIASLTSESLGLTTGESIAETGTDAVTEVQAATTGSVDLTDATIAAALVAATDSGGSGAAVVINVAGTDYSLAAVSGGYTSATLATALDSALSATGMSASIDADGQLVVSEDTGSDGTTIAVSITSGYDVVGTTTQVTGVAAATASAATATAGSSGYTVTGDDVSFDVNGTTVTLSATGGDGAGVYDTDALVTAISAALTADGNTDVTVSNVAGALTFTSATTGAAATVTVDGFDGLEATDLGFADADITEGTEISVADQDSATTALDTIDAAIDLVSKARASIGALESRFSFRSESIATSIENLEAANSAITDTDVAAESSKLASAKVKTQAAVAAAAQASQMPQDLLKLLQ